MPKRGRGYWLEERNGIWRVCWTEARRKRTRSSGTKDYDKAVQWAERFTEELEKPAQPERPTIASIIDGYLHERQDRHSYRSMLCQARHVKEHMGWLTISELRPAHSKAYGTKRNTQGASVGSVRNELMLLRTALRWAQGELLVGQIPKIEVPSSPPPRDRWLTREETESLMRCTGARHVKLFIRLALGTAARSGAILELRWTDVDFERSLVSFGHRAGGKRRVTVPIADRLREELHHARMVAQTPFVIEYAGQRVRRMDRGAFARAVKRAGIAHCTPHDLRRTAGSWMLQSGISMEVIARMLGHSSTEITHKVYAKHDVDWLRDAARALEG